MNLGLPYITEGLKGTGGAIRKFSEHFIVEEIPLYEPSGEGNHLYINFTKVGMNSIDIQKKVSRLLDIKEKDIGIAGLKDKNAVTTQTISIALDNKNRDDIIKKIEDNIDIKINSTSLHNNKLKPGHLLGNKFTIIITDVKDDAFSKAKKIIEKIDKIGVPNYFGLQRFGIDQNNIKKGHDLLKGKIKIRDRWLKRFLISSYQSYLCNVYLAERIRNNMFHKIIKGDVAKKYDTGGMFDVTDEKKEQVRFDDKQITFTAPIYGIKMWGAKEESKKFEDKILRESDITIKDLEKNKIKGTRRTGRIFIDDLKVIKCTEGIKLSFSLRKGSFATVLLREIMKKEVN